MQRIAGLMTRDSSWCSASPRAVGPSLIGTRRQPTRPKTPPAARQPSPLASVLPTRRSAVECWNLTPAAITAVLALGRSLGTRATTTPPSATRRSLPASASTTTRATTTPPSARKRSSTTIPATTRPAVPMRSPATSTATSTPPAALTLCSPTPPAATTPPAAPRRSSSTPPATRTPPAAPRAFANKTGNENTACGAAALYANTAGINNTAVGSLALQNSTGNQNIAVGQGAGAALTSGNKNIYLGHPGAASESKTMRLGNTQTQTYIAGVATAAVTGAQVLIDADGRLGVPLSSARYKQDIEPLGARSAGVHKLRPVTFATRRTRSACGSTG